MTEAERLARDRPELMLEFVQGKGSDRKLRLFACGCCRRVWSLLSDKHSQKALAMAERYADAEVSKKKLALAWQEARLAAWAARDKAPRRQWTVEAMAMQAVSGLCEADIDRAVDIARSATSCEACKARQAPPADAQWEQLLLLRDIFGNLCRPFNLNPAWLAWNDGTVRRLAEAIYNERSLPDGHLDVTRMGVLADALEDAGCSDHDLLDHLRGPGPHVRGCCAVDLLLGKE
jgi:hypothetical protein